MHDHYFSILPQHLEAVPKTFDDVRMSCLVLVAEATGPAAFPVERRVQACLQPREANPLGGAPSGARLPPAAHFQVYVNSDVILPLLKLVCNCLLVIIMGLTVNLTRAGRCGNATWSPTGLAGLRATEGFLSAGCGGVPLFCDC